MQILLDTHIFLWWLSDDKQLSEQAKKTIISADLVYVSSVSIWEASIKIGLKKLEANIDELVEAIVDEGFKELPLLSRQAAIVAGLPPHHRDPFDRMLIAQTISEPLRFLTSDKILKQYSELVEIV